MTPQNSAYMRVQSDDKNLMSTAMLKLRRVPQPCHDIADGQIDLRMWRTTDTDSGPDGSGAVGRIDERNGR